MKKLFAFVLLIASTVFSAVEKMPYLLFEGENTAMTILWQLTSTKATTVKWGKTQSYELGSGAATKFGNDYQYRYDLTGLTPNTLYYYSVEGVGDGSFRTAPEANATSVKLFAYGDTRTYPNAHNSVCNQILTQIRNDPARQTAIFFSGDYVGTGGSERDWSNQFFPTSKSGIVELQSKLPIVGCIGNHENRSGGPTVFKKYYPFPHVTSKNFYWSVDYGPVHVVFVDIYTTSFSTGSAQHNWIKSDLASTDKEWKIMVFHGPGYSASENSGSGHKNDREVQNYLQPLCTEFGVDLVINGDNHYYSRAVVDGVQHITTGGGGAPLYNPSASSPYIVKANKSNHFCEIDINKNECTVTARKKSGSVIESFTLQHEASTPKVSILSPTKDTTIVLDSIINITSSIDALGGNIEKVDFYVNGTKVSTSTYEPYNYEISSPTETKDTISFIATIDGVTYNSDTVIVSIVDPANTVFVTTTNINQNANNAEEDIANGAVVLGEYNNIYIVDYASQTGTSNQEVGFRFESVQLPDHAKITDASIQFTASKPGADNASFSIYGENVKSSNIFTNSTYNISRRTKTSNNVNWSPSNWVAEEASSAQQTPNLTPLIEEIISQNGWTTGDPLTFIFTGSGARVAHSFKSSPSNSAALSISYKLPTGILPTTKRVDTKSDFYIVPNPAETRDDVSAKFYLSSENIKRYISCKVEIFSSVGGVIYSSGDIFIGASYDQSRPQLISEWNLRLKSGIFAASGSYLAVVTCTDRKGDKRITKKTIGIKGNY